MITRTLIALAFLAATLSAQCWGVNSPDARLLLPNDGSSPHYAVIADDVFEIRANSAHTPALAYLMVALGPPSPNCSGAALVWNLPYTAPVAYVFSLIGPPSVLAVSLPAGLPPFSMQLLVVPDPAAAAPAYAYSSQPAFVI